MSDMEKTVDSRFSLPETGTYKTNGAATARQWPIRFMDVSDDTVAQLESTRQHSVGHFYPYRSQEAVSIEAPLDSLPLLRLIDSAAYGDRVHEFMSIDRPGDVLHYWRICCASLPDDLIKHIKPRFPGRPEIDPPTFPYLSYVEFDRRFVFGGEDTEPAAACWIDYRNSPLLHRQADDDLALVRKYQTLLRQAGNMLLKREIEQIDQRTHPRDYLAAPKRHCDSSQCAGATLSVPEAVIDATAELVSRNSVHSASCWVQDYWLWRTLVGEQVRRSESTGQPPQSALHLSGPDRGLPDFSIGDWGGQVHIPYEGACVANLHFKPRWQYLYPYDETPPDDTPCRFFRPKPMIHDEMCLYLITDEDFGTLSGAMREKICDGWFLYTRLGIPGLNQRPS